MEIVKYIILSAAEIEKIDFSEILETSVDSLRFSNDRSQTFIKFIGDRPSFLGSVNEKSREYSHAEILNILGSSQWN